MTTNAARKMACRTLTMDRVALAELDDAAMVALMLERHEGAWREFLRRYDRDLRAMVGKRLCKAMTMILDSDAIDDVIGDLYALLVDREMRCLRIWATKERPGTLISWLGLLANGIAVDHIRAAYVRIAASFDGNGDCGDDDEDGSHDKRGQRNERDLDPNRGAAWLGAERAAEIGLLADEPKKKRRNRKSRDDQ